MQRERLLIPIVGLGLLLAATSAVAHHSSSVWNKEHRIVLKGSVTDVSFANPHVLIHFEAKGDKGNLEQWTAESGPPQRLYRVGWNTKTLKPGDTITVTGILAKDGRKLVNIRELVGPRGQTLLEGAD